MRYVAAYLLAVLGGNESPTEADIKKILSSVGVDVNADNLKKVIAQLKGKNIEELMAEGRTKLASMPAAGPAVAAAAPAAAAGAPAAKEEKKAKEKEPESEPEDDDMGFGLFD